MANVRYLERYDSATRSNHWVVAILFFMAALSGLAFFHPAMYFLSNLFGGGVWSRILHPFFGVLMFASFVGIYVRLWKDNVWKADDSKWLSKAGDMMSGNKAGLPPVGKYNGGQKLVFWLMTVSLAVLLITGVMFWRPWFAGYFPIPLIRLGLLLHAASATVLVLSVIVHVYAAIWVKGTTRAMTRGTVSEGWARLNHPLWHRDVTGGK